LEPQPLARRPREIVADYSTYQVVVNGGASILEASDLDAQHQMSF